MEQALKVEWIDRHREPQCPPNPRYPNGIDVDVSGGAESCVTDVPYPAKRCGAYHVTCKRCGYSALVTTAGRVDDPRTVRVPCQRGQA